MCRRVTCGKCGRPSFAGCGMHVEAVLGDVPAGDRCRCREDGRRAGGEATPVRSFFRNLFGK
jgi:hypothetical protein